MSLEGASETESLHIAMHVQYLHFLYSDIPYATSEPLYFTYLPKPEAGVLKKLCLAGLAKLAD
jgi:hypothetical protein